jgi:hypothetical protein
MRKKSEAARQRGSEAVAKAAAPRWTSEPETAAAIGVTRAALSHWRRVMNLPTPECWQRAGNDRLMYDAAACAKWRAENLEPERSGRVAKCSSGQVRGKKSPPPSGGVPKAAAPSVTPPLDHSTTSPLPAVAGHVAAKAESEKLRTQLLEIELGRKRGRLLEAGEVEAAWSAGLTRVRRAAMGVPARVVSELAGSHGLSVEQERALIDSLVKGLDAAIAGAAG